MGQHTEDTFQLSLSNRKENILENQLSNVFRKEGQTDQQGNALPSGGINHVEERSRHAFKMEYLSQNPQATKTELAKATGITSYSTLHNTQAKCHLFGQYVFSECGVKNLYEVKPSHVAQFLGELADRGYNIKTFKAYCSALQHLDVGLNNAYPSNSHGDWQSVIDECKQYAKELCPATNQENTPRAYIDPQAVINNIGDERVRFGAGLALDMGLRQNEVCHNTRIDETHIQYRGKGGMVVTKELTPSQAQEYTRLFPSGEMCIKVDHYAYELKKGCESAGENWTGTHSLRHNFAVEKLNDYTSQGYSYHQAKCMVSQDMGHSRPEITECYLR